MPDLHELTFSESVLVAIAFGGVALAIAFLIAAIFYGDGLMFAEGLLSKKDTRPDVGLAILDPADEIDPAAYDRGDDDDPTGEQVVAGIKLLRATAPRDNLTDPIDEDPYEDITYADVQVAPSPLLTPIPQHSIEWAVKAGRFAELVVAMSQKARGDRWRFFRRSPYVAAILTRTQQWSTEEFDAAFAELAEAEGHPVVEPGPREPLRGRRIEWAEPELELP